jgi:hypothetical protein
MYKSANNSRKGQKLEKKFKKHVRRGVYIARLIDKDAPLLEADVNFDIEFTDCNIE